MGLYSGQPNVSYPLYEIDNGYVKVPIMLSYNYNGLKVEDYPGWVGTGWTLNVPNLITRQTRSLPDEGINGFNGQNKKGLDVIDYINSGITPTVNNFQEAYPAYYALLNGIVGNQIDSEPDQFTFSIPGYSGKFYFDESQCNNTTKTAIVVPHQNINIKGYFDYGYSYNTLRGQIYKFEITDERGNLYTFNVKERTREAHVEDADNGNPNLDFENTWYLSSIEDPFHQTINFIYKPARKVAMPATVSERLVIPQTFNATPQYNEVDTWEVVLSEITFRNGKVEFVEAVNDRLDWDYANFTDFVAANHGDNLTRPKALSKIRIISGNSVVKEVRFSYSYFGANARLRLDSFQETNGSVSMPPYKFTYNNYGVFPLIGNKKALFSQDHWGYYTGEEQNTLIPPINLLTQEGATVSIPGNFRLPRTNATAIGILTQIEYPTGGTTTLTYQQNEYDRFSNQFVVPFGQCGTDMLLVANPSLKFTLPPAADKTKELTIPVTMIENGCAKISFSLSAGSCIDNSASFYLKNTATGEFVTSHVQRVDAGGTQYTFTGPGHDQVFFLRAGNYELHVMIECIYCPDIDNFKAVEASVSLFTSASEDPSLRPNLPAGGMRVAEIKDCAIGGVSGCVTKYFNYHDVNNPSRSSGVLVNSPIYSHDVAILYLYGLTIYDVGGVAYTGSSQLPVTTTSGNAVGYQYVTVMEAKDGSKGKSVLKFTSPKDQPNTASAAYPYTEGCNSFFPYPPIIDKDYRRGIQVLQQDYAVGGTTPLKESDATPEFYLKKSFKGLRFGDRVIIDQSLAGLQVSRGMNDYLFVPYTVESSWKNISSQTETVHDPANNKEITIQTNLFYENPNHLLVTRKEVTSSVGELIRTTYAYPDDAASLQNLSAAELAGIQSCPDKSALIESKEFRNGTLLRTKRNLFNGVTLAKILTSESTSPLEDEVVFNQYDDTNGNLLSFTTRNGDMHSYCYGYNKTLPTAHVLNAAHTEIFYESFEESGTLVGDQAKTGVNVLNAGSFTFPSAFTPINPSALKMTYWYFQDNQWNFSGELPFSASINTSGTQLDEIRVYPAGARMSTFCYKPGVGMITRMDENHMAQYFKFDDMGKLVTVKNNDKNVVNGYDYYYKKGN
ncbi:MAG: hypothetical protein ACOYXT_13140 [Bacteroidota bacterium]